MQRQAASFLNGPMLVLAGPGSGKTHVITKRVQYLIEEHHMPPESILVITFTRAAAMEMKLRAQNMCESASRAVFGTFHSVFYHILQKSDRYKDYRLLTDRQKNQLINRIVKHTAELPLYYGAHMQEQSVAEEFMVWMSRRKNGACLDDKLQNSSDSKEQLFCQMQKRYAQECESMHRMDFDDILVELLNLFRSDTGLLANWQRRFRYILVDEFQDINPVQYASVSLLGKKHRNLFMVGDDDQSIYRFRASDIQIMQQFLGEYPEAKQVTLSDNYRCKQEIVTYSAGFIQRNEKRFAKELKSMQKEPGNVALNAYADVHEMQEMVRDSLQELRGNETAAILLRTNQSAQNWAKWLKEKGYETKSPKADSSIYQLDWVKDVLAVLRFVHQGQHRSDFIRFMNKPERYLLRDGIPDPVNLTELLSCYQREMIEKEADSVLESRQQICDALIRLQRQLAFLIRLDPYASIQYVLSVMGYEACIKQTEQYQKQCLQLKQEAKKFLDVPSYLTYVTKILQGERDSDDARLHGDDTAFDKKIGKNEENETKNQIHVMTYHGSKGLEFDRVILPEVNAGMVPHGRYLEREDLEEERRVFYVAMTRAKSELVILYHQSENTKQNLLSPFILELLHLQEKKEGLDSFRNLDLVKMDALKIISEKSNNRD